MFFDIDLAFVLFLALLYARLRHRVPTESHGRIALELSGKDWLPARNSGCLDGLSFRLDGLRHIDVPASRSVSGVCRHPGSTMPWLHIAMIDAGSVDL